MVRSKSARGAAVMVAVALTFAVANPGLVPSADFTGTAVGANVVGSHMAGLPVSGSTVPGVEVAPSSSPAPLATPVGVLPERNPVPDGGRAKVPGDSGEATTVWDLPAGTRYLNPVSGRKEFIDPSIARSAVLIGDSQSAGAQGVKGSDTWVEMGLAARGYKVCFMGAGGTGFVAATSIAANYPDAVESGKMVLPYGNPALVVVQGGGNDAAQGKNDALILANAARLLRDLKTSYPTSKFLFIGTLARGNQADGRRTQVDALLAGFAQRNGIEFISAGDWLTRYGVTHKMADGVHLTASGHKDLSHVLAGKLKALNLAGPRAG